MDMRRRMGKTSYAIAIGSNRPHGRFGVPKGVVRSAVERLGPVLAVSTIRATPAMGPAGRGFANAVVLLESDLAPDELLDELQAIERDFGRRGGRRWGPRVLDLDIILWSGGAWGGPGPIIPHPEFCRRAFVLEPLAEIARSWRDPLTGATVAQLLARFRRPRVVDRARHHL
jgi:2-amino-4-hydroxy-6-hydroxymethyldihydropteridine diphosphokinase